jgi:anti-sigma regulatory factor (Ser/Thr protein kinase)
VTAAWTPDGGVTRPPDASSHVVDLPSLGRLRDAVTRGATECGLSGPSISNLVLVANELATNVVRHGGGTGRMWLWCADGCMYCQVVDAGPGLSDPEAVGTSPSEPTALTGRGMWLVRQMSDQLHIRTGPGGTAVTVAMDGARVASG